MLTKQEIIFATDDLPRERVEVPEWPDVELYVRTMTALERDKFEAEQISTRGDEPVVNLKNLRARLCVVTVVDADGVRVFADDAAEALGEKSSRAVDRLFSVAQRLNGLGPDDVEDLVKN